MREDAELVNEAAAKVAAELAVEERAAEERQRAREWCKRNRHRGEFVARHSDAGRES
jgi:hypothetical protein